MGAQDFQETSKGGTINEAFENAVEQARHEHGHGGYTGTIAEKHDFTEIKCLPDKTPQQMMDLVMEDDDHWAQDKWGPAAAIQTGENEWTFFGWASS